MFSAWKHKFYFIVYLGVDGKLSLNFEKQVEYELLQSAVSVVDEDEDESTTYEPGLADPGVLE